MLKEKNMAEKKQEKNSNFRNVKKMEKVEIKDLIDSGVHFGHLTRKWNPNMSNYIYSEKNGIHIINLYKTSAKLQEACEALKKLHPLEEKFYL